ncbi:MAG: hypothetical protein RLN80_03185, partial [Rhodospirillales bacterium]
MKPARVDGAAADDK